MSTAPLEILKFAAIPVSAMVVGGAVAAHREPSAQVRSTIQHFAAGVVLAAVAGEVVPELLHHHSPVATAIGFTLGVAAMLAVKALTGGEEAEGERSPRGLLTVVGIDVSIDGLLIGVGFAAGAKQGVLLTVALTLEVLFLGVATCASLRKSGMVPRRAVASVAGLAALLLGGAAAGALLQSVLAGPVLVGVLGFSSAALLYLVVEELLVEAHEVPETPVATAVFFLGFLVLFLVEMMA